MGNIGGLYKISEQDLQDLQDYQDECLNDDLPDFGRNGIALLVEDFFEL